MSCARTHVQVLHLGQQHNLRLDAYLNKCSDALDAARTASTVGDVAHLANPVWEVEADRLNADGTQNLLQYPPDICVQIETRYRQHKAGKPVDRLVLLGYSHRLWNYSIDVRNMTQTNITTNKIRSIQRQPRDYSWAATQSLGYSAANVYSTRGAARLSNDLRHRVVDYYAHASALAPAHDATIMARARFEELHERTVNEGATTFHDDVFFRSRITEQTVVFEEVESSVVRAVVAMLRAPALFSKVPPLPPRLSLRPWRNYVAFSRSDSHTAALCRPWSRAMRCFRASVSWRRC